jgi:hypothetical protein
MAKFQHKKTSFKILRKKEENLVWNQTLITLNRNGRKTQFQLYMWPKFSCKWIKSDVYLLKSSLAIIYVTSNLILCQNKKILMINDCFYHPWKDLIKIEVIHDFLHSSWLQGLGTFIQELKGSHKGRYVTNKSSTC